MLALLILAILGVSLVGLTLFAAMCLAIRNDDKKGLPSQPPTLTAAFTRRVLGMTRSRPVPSRRAERPCLAGSGASPGSRPDPEGR